MDWFKESVFFSNGMLDRNKNYIVFGQKKYLEMCNTLIDRGLYISHFCEQDDLDCNMSGVSADIEVIKIRSLLMYMKSANVLLISDFCDELKESLTKYGFTDVMVIYALWFISFVGYNKAIYGAVDKINRVLDILEDDESKRVYKCVINAKLTLDSDYLEQACDKRTFAYFDDELIKLTDEEVFIDGGCFNCDTSLMFMAKVKGKFKKIYMFEPSTNSFMEIKKRLDCINDDRLVCLNKGLYDKESVIGFEDHPYGGSGIDESAVMKIETDYLDNITDEATFIKLDIEGAEAKALLGARKLIESQKPKLAVCVYHKHEDLWELPLLIKSLNPSYKLYIRQYLDCFIREEKNDNAMAILDTVCYAIDGSQA